MVIGGGINATTRGTFNPQDASMRCPYPPLNASGMALEGANLSATQASAAGWLVKVQVALNGQQYSRHGHIFHYFATPLAVSTIEPPLGPRSGGTNVTITGGTFVDTGAVFCYLYKLAVLGINSQVYDEWVPAELDTPQQSRCTTTTWAVAEEVKLYMSLNRLDLVRSVSAPQPACLRTANGQLYA
jgi:hypothetical protein